MRAAPLLLFFTPLLVPLHETSFFQSLPFQRAAPLIIFFSCVLLCAFAWDTFSWKLPLSVCSFITHQSALILWLFLCLLVIRVNPCNPCPNLFFYLNAFAPLRETSHFQFLPFPRAALYIMALLSASAPLRGCLRVLICVNLSGRLVGSKLKT